MLQVFTGKISLGASRFFNNEKFIRVLKGTGSLIPHSSVDKFVTGGGTGYAYLRTLCTREFQIIRFWRGARSRFREKLNVEMREHREFVVS